MLNPFLPFVYVLSTDPSINWDSSIVTKSNYSIHPEVHKLKFYSGQYPTYKFHIRRLSFEEFNYSKEFVDVTKAKLYILNRSITQIEDGDGSLINVENNTYEDQLRNLLNLDELLELADVCYNAQTITNDQLLWLKMSAWINTEELDNAMQVPCGCKLLTQAEQEIDRTAADLLREEAPEFQKQWNCNGDGVCSEKALESIIPLSKLIKINPVIVEKNLTRCPQYFLSRAWINEAVGFYNWRDKAQLNVLFTDSKAFKNTIKEAIDAISSGISRYEQYHRDKLIQDRKNKENESNT